MNSIEILKNEFQTASFNFDQRIKKIISSKMNDGTVFPPYIPFIGKNYDKYKVLSYATAQNINPVYQLFLQKKSLEKQANYLKLSERLLEFNETYPEKPISYRNIAINPYRCGILPALLGVFLYAKFGKKIINLDELNDYIAVTNYYKFSLNNGKDIHPEKKLPQIIGNKTLVENFWDINDKLVEKELEVLSPEYIIVFNGRKVTKLREMINSQCKIIKINDPSWILQGGGGKLKKGKGWGVIVEEYKNSEISELITEYLKGLDGNYKGRDENSFVYLLHYYHEWKIVL